MPSADIDYGFTDILTRPRSPERKCCRRRKTTATTNHNDDNHHDKTFKELERDAVALSRSLPRVLIIQDKRTLPPPPRLGWILCIISGVSFSFNRVPVLSYVRLHVYRLRLYVYTRDTESLVTRGTARLVFSSSPATSTLLLSPSGRTLDGIRPKRLSLRIYYTKSFSLPSRKKKKRDMVKTEHETFSELFTHATVRWFISAEIVAYGRP